MTLAEFKSHLVNLTELNFQLASGENIPNHFHITEVGTITKNFIDCGGTLRTEKFINFQLWYTHDVDHRLRPQKLLNIIKLSENKIGLGDFEIEVEYQMQTIGKFGLNFQNNTFILTNKATNCLAEDRCGIAPIQETVSCCTPNGGCC